MTGDVPQPRLLEIDDLALGYGEGDVVEGITFALSEGDIGCLLGPSGCGKSTILRALAGFLPISAGEIRLRTQVISKPGRTTPPEKRRIGMVFQDYALFPHLSVADNIGFGLKGMGSRDRRKKVDELLELIQLQAAKNTFPHELSGGQQQRIALARALAPEPTIVLLDEPFSNLDADLRRRLSVDVRSILKTLGIGAILVTHDQNEAFAMCDQVAVLREGRLQQWDTPYHLYHEPANRFVAGFVGQGGFVPGTAAAADSVHTELGLIKGEAPHGWPEGKQLDVLIRPDDVVHDRHSQLRPEVINRTFAGRAINYQLKVSDATILETQFRSHLDFDLGEKVPVRIDAEHLIAFEPEDR